MAGLVLGTVAAGLTLDAMLHEQAFFDVWAINKVQAIDLPFLGRRCTRSRRDRVDRRDPGLGGGAAVLHR